MSGIRVEGRDVDVLGTGVGSCGAVCRRDGLDLRISWSSTSMEGHKNVGGAGLPSTPEEDAMVAKIDNRPDDGAKKDLGVRWGRLRGRLDGDMGGRVLQ